MKRNDNKKIYQKGYFIAQVINTNNCKRYNLSHDYSIGEMENPIAQLSGEEREAEF